MKYVVSVSKSYIHRGLHIHKPSTKKRWFIYYYDEDGQFHSEQVSYVKAMYFKKHKWRRLKYYCEICEKLFLLLAKSKKQLECPSCGY